MEDRFPYVKAQVEVVFFENRIIFMNSSMQQGPCDQYSRFISSPDGSEYLCLDVYKDIHVPAVSGYKPNCRIVSPTPYIQNNVLCIGFSVISCQSVVY